MMNFNDLPFIDHHCHPYDTRKAILEPEFLAREFYHGMGDIPDLNLPKARMWGATDELRYHFPHMGMAHGFPHVWVDMGQMTPWASLRIAECYREVMAWAPLSKIVVGSGGHGTPEIAWLAAKTAKIALAEVFEDGVRLKLITKSDAETAANMILHDNAARLYGLI